MRPLILLFIIPSAELARLAPQPSDYLSPPEGDTWSPKQPPRPSTRKYSQYIITAFNWTINRTKFYAWNDFNITINMEEDDLGIKCKFDRTPVAIRLIPADRAESCSYYGGLVAYCPDFNSYILAYADSHGPGDYVLTSFSDGTLEGLHSTSGGFCDEGFQVPIKIISVPRDHAKFSNEKPIIQFHPRPKQKHRPSSVFTASMLISILVSLITVVIK
ncbi:hypothetical protein PMAYCL1PPCAC_30784 [Pristionchus mayeri]|uniref:Uncharacterized protein n=1 Tax=Pristionchus mayeri TaxID=1317129 RepID=A0AAN5DCH7_9BILA|nr:hypothetical protein PMAYCL1PPCAC_30784 [Pristionchus mayeri]